MKKTRKQFRAFRKGFTLAEALLATALLSIATAGAVLPFTSGASVQAEGIHRTFAAGLADDLMQKIMVEDFNDIISIYGSYTESQGGIKDAAGNVINDPGYYPFSRQSTCTEVFLSQQDGSGDENFILATVTVSYNGKALVEIQRLIAK